MGDTEETGLDIDLSFEPTKPKERSTPLGKALETVADRMNIKLSDKFFKDIDKFAKGEFEGYLTYELQVPGAKKFAELLQKELLYNAVPVGVSVQGGKVIFTLKTISLPNKPVWEDKLTNEVGQLVFAAFQKSYQGTVPFFEET